jgi:hypothetical protein
MTVDGFKEEILQIMELVAFSCHTEFIPERVKLFPTPGMINSMQG